MPTPRKKRALRPLSVAVLFALAATAVGASFFVRSVVADQERRLLNGRANEVAILVGTLFGGARTTLTTLAAGAPPQNAPAFTAAAERLLATGASGIGALRSDGGRIVVVAAAGTAPPPGTAVTGARADMATRAAATGQLVTAVTDDTGVKRISFAMPVGDGLVLYEDLGFDLSQPIDLGPQGPFDELDGVVYASASEDPSNVVLRTTDELVLSGTVERLGFPVGADEWLLVVRSNQPLVGTVAAQAPWAILALGLVATLLTTMLVETLGRRRAYAVALVEERTVALRQALEERSRLEQGERQAREAAEAASRAKDDFLSRMSHELRTPLNAVLGFAQLLELDPLSAADRESVAQILKGGRHLLDLINEVLDLARIETGTLALSAEPVLVAEVVDDVLALLGPLATSRGIEVVSDAATCRQYVVADRQRLKQVVLNLVANAVKYNHERGRVTLSCEVAGSRLRLCVDDTGPGIAPDDLERVFLPFERLGAEQTDVEGTGVGLAVSRRLAEAMQGSLGVASTVGRGSTFWIELPVTEDPLAAYGDHDGDAPAAADGRRDAEIGARRTILYVEDNLSNVRLVERALADRPDVALVPTMQGRMAVELAREHDPALVLLDLHLPDIGGVEVLRLLREQPATASTPVVVVSADATPGQIERLLEAGASAYLTKPLDIPALRRLVGDAMAAVG